MNLLLNRSTLLPNSNLQIAGSKSISNRLLILQQQFTELTIQNLSDAEDTLLLKQALTSSSQTIDVHHAGTAMRFLTAFFASQEDREVVLTGSNRMKERPIGVLVLALQELGASISYLENEGFPPLKIVGKKIKKNKLSINSGVSSQFISALLLIAPSLENGLEITLSGNKTSLPYLEMTINLLTQMGISVLFSGNNILVKPFQGEPEIKQFKVESDWSTASYFYSFTALSPVGTTLILNNFQQDSLQGDNITASLFEQLGVETTFSKGTILLTKTRSAVIKELILDLNNSPDLAQTLAVCCFGLQIPFHFNGLQTLKIKETDRLEALETELSKLGAKVIVSADSISMRSLGKPLRFQNQTPEIATYNDHRMAMAFSPLALLFPIKIKEAEVVKKSCPLFWDYLSKIGISFSSY
ncbi:3-phosphoshikimate 1-carboxyvinyltransferase [Planktosalinus lacus]|uniref:3-phosphoshikimate 1-carboxyvinyltransferase n=1 Tax=Planktosalinus lacus TaxID=1526573 RepID=A0A8J2V9G9_9FLAO|nr:3-phosphoshikimate 1-carboxyvinyltransferase [Planktosalinus lacus]GGD89464.1 3-phosphoshikimate 1-carboxyvinyltransferase [Planktosalinus lacus]